MHRVGLAAVRLPAPPKCCACTGATQQGDGSLRHSSTLGRNTAFYVLTRGTPSSDPASHVAQQGLCECNATAAAPSTPGDCRRDSVRARPIAAGRPGRSPAARTPPASSTADRGPRPSAGRGGACGAGRSRRGAGTECRSRGGQAAPAW